jgi:hypothetical protein
MDDMMERVGQMAWRFLLLAAACLGPGAALATCNPTLPVSAGSIPCYMNVQPIDVCNTLGVCAPFNTTATTGTPSGPSGAGMPFSPQTNLPPFVSGVMLPNNPTSSNPIGFTVDPSSGATNPGTSNGVDVTRELLNNIGIELVWYPMASFVVPNTQTSNKNLTSLNVSFKPGSTAATGCTGSISGTTLTITAACKTGALAVYDLLSGGSIVTSPATFISALGTGSGGVGTYTVNQTQSVKSTTITASNQGLASPDFLTLSQQDTSSNAPNCAISTSGCVPVAPLGGGGNPPSNPFLTPPDPTVVNLFFVNKINPPTSGGTLYGFAWICNNGVAIGGNTFFAPTPLQARPDTIAHELLHNLCLDHTIYGAGPYLSNSTSNPNGGILPPFPAKPLTLECDPAYPGCGANLMTAGNLRTEPAVVLSNGSIVNCALAGFNAEPVPSACSGLASLFNGMADQVAVQVTTGSSLLPSFASVIPGATPATTAQLPVSQQAEALTTGSGLLFNNIGNDGTNPVIPPLMKLSGLLAPIPYETTKAQLDTGSGSANRVNFDLSGPIDGRPGETLVAWVLTLPEELTFAKYERFDIVSQSRQDLVQDVEYYPDSANNALMRKIAYDGGGNNNPDDGSIGTPAYSPCTFAPAGCLTVKFQPPGLGAHDSINFSTAILKGDTPVTNEDLCKAKITYMFSDGFVTTSNFRRCPASPQPLIASSWRPDPHVAPHVIKSNVLLVADGGPPLGCTPTDNVCPDASASAPADADYTTAGGQPTQTCDNGATFGSINASGVIKGPVGGLTINAGQRCNYTNCEILGNLTINGGQVYLNCQLDGNLTVNSGLITLGELAHVLGNVNISPSAGSTLADGFNIGNGNSTNKAQIDGNLGITNLTSPPSQGGSICNTLVKGSVTVQNNQSQSAIEIGDPNDSCPGNTIGGSLVCTRNRPHPTFSSNTVGGHTQCSS